MVDNTGKGYGQGMQEGGSRSVISQNKAANAGKDNLPVGLCVKIELNQQASALGG